MQGTTGGFQWVEHPAQVLSPLEFAERLRIDYASGTLDEPRVLYRTDAGTTLGPAVIVEPWPSDVRAREGRMARAMVRGDEYHQKVCGRGALRTWERESCGTCALLGWRPPNDNEWPTGRPNYGGWARVYVQAGEPIPRAWLPAFVDELNDAESASYRECLRRDVATWGFRLTDERPGYRLRTPTAETVRAYLLEQADGDPEFEMVEALREIVRDADEYEAAAVRAAAKALASSVGASR